MALVVCHRGDAQQRAAGVGPGRELGGVDGGLGDVHAVGGQRVQLEQPTPGPVAGRDDRGGSREHRALADADVIGVVSRRAVAERHVDEHDQPQPARLRHEHLGRRRRDQPVEQHDGAVRNPRQHAREGGEAPARRARSQKPLTACSLDRPAERGEPAADMSVIDVAPARPGRVVDAVRQDGVHRRHSGRS